MKSLATGYNGMKLLSRLVIVVIICLIAMALLSVPAQAQCGGPLIKLSPESGPPGTEVTVTGQGFAKSKYVDISHDRTLMSEGNKTSASGGFSIIFTIPEGCKGDYQVHAVVVHDTADAYFIVEPGLTISPAEGPVGTNVTVTGQGFAQNEEGIELRYYLDDNYKTIQSGIAANATGSWETSFQIPPSTSGEHNLGAQSAVTKLYEVKVATFEVTAGISMDKLWGSVNESVTMTGSRFMPYDKNIQILFAGQTVVTGIKANTQGDWEESFDVPEMPTGTYNVTAGGTVTPKEDINELSFEIKPDIVLPANEGYVGMNLTITGHGFAASEDVNILYNGSQRATATTKGTGSFEASFVVPESQYGEHQVTAEDAAGNNATAILIMESTPPPMPTLISPSNRGWVGIVNKVRPTFKWSAVSDPSGVYYNLQIATSANVTAAGEFVHPLVSIPDIAATNYTLDKKDALSCGTYYWIVQAVDRAGNAGNWTAAHSFRAGLLPLWAFILIIVAIVVLLGGLIYFFIRRRRYYYD
ncbi:MAG: IPT/TIG domain-containing protein [Dehalococcoidia bacterium]